MLIHPATEPTDDGSPTLVHPLFGERYHSCHGSVTESRHTFIDAGLAQCTRPRASIFEMGFGSGLNALLSLMYAAEHQTDITYHAIDLYPVDPSVCRALSYPELAGCDRELFHALHDAPWDRLTAITDRFTILKRECDIADYHFDHTYDLAYWDAFAPDSTPEAWSCEVFGRLHRHMSPGGILVTYCAKGSVKQALRQAGFAVTRLPGAPGKRHMVRAAASF